MNRHLVPPLEHPPKFEHVRALAESLIGTCHMSDPEELEDWSMEELREFDSLCFSCTNCGWWCDAEECHDHNDEWVCAECFDDLGGDDDT